jgi:uncharacterized protein (TIGR03435 family)
MQDLPAYLLVAGKKRLKFESVRETGDGSLRLGPGGVSFKQTTMRRFAEFLSGLSPIERPVLDRTSLQGTFDFTLTVSDFQPDPAGVGARPCRFRR